jgi:SAM-dependent methyltransferase
MDRHTVGYAGWRDYSPLLLNLYDPLVVGPIARYVWRCPADRLVARYRQYIRPGHLDVGPGTGFFLARSGLSTATSVTIVDPNPNVLRHARGRLSNLDVTAVKASVLEPLPVPGGFQSAALHLVIHCLPGPFARKAIAVANVARVSAPDGVFFGASVLGRSGRHSRLARGFLAAFNRQGGFDNLDDSEESLRAMLEQSFDDVELSTIGSIAVFSATGPKTAA